MDHGAIGQSGNQGWTVVLDKVAEDDEYCWQGMVVGVDKNLTYAHAEKIAYGYITEGEIEFDFHRDVALRIWGGFEQEWIDVAISDRFDEPALDEIPNKQSAA